MAVYSSKFYEGRYVQGVIAGHMSKNGKAGYIASFPILKLFVVSMRFI